MTQMSQCRCGRVTSGAEGSGDYRYHHPLPSALLYRPRSSEEVAEATSEGSVSTFEKGQKGEGLQKKQRAYIYG